MDSVSQFALGAAIAEATLGSRLGRRAMLFGGILGTLPDLDVLVHYDDAVASFTYHRSWSHSLFVLGALSPVLAWLLHIGFPRRWVLQTDRSSLAHAHTSRPGYLRWFCCVFLVLATHPLLDGFTVYGTQLLWPLAVAPVAWGSVFIIDPAYTVPLIVALIIAYRNRALARRAAVAGLFISSFYLVLTLASQQHARTLAMDSLQKAELGASNVLVAPSPLSLLWRIVSMDGDTYHEGYYSLLDSSNTIEFASYPSNRALINTHHAQWSVARMDWFTAGMISASREDDKFIINDLRMGIEASYIFRFLVGRWNDNVFEAVESEQLPIQLDKARIVNIVKRVWDERVRVKP